MRAGGAHVQVPDRSAAGRLDTDGWMMCAVLAEALVVVSGALASGKSTLARPLARMLGFA